MTSTKRMPTYFISHGGGPWPWLEGPIRNSMENLKRSLEALPKELPEKPKAILLISGHWEADDFSVMSSPRPPMYYDYYGFPDHTYNIHYQAPGSPELARKVNGILASAGLRTSLDSERGFDHGAFVPLAVAFPEADIPVVQLSLRADYDPETHLKVGRLLSPLRDEGVLIIGSGLSYHNMRMFDARGVKPSYEFDAWLTDTLVNGSPVERRQKLIEWEKAPSARLAHPQEDHLLPLMVAAGAAEDDKATRGYHDEKIFGGITASSFRFGG